VQRRESVPTRTGRRAGFAPGAAILAVAACLGLSACSPGAEYPSLFPAVHDMPPPRAETPLDPVQVQQATEDLITARDHLSAEMQGGQAKTPPGAPNQTKAGDKAAEKKKHPNAEAAAAGGKQTDAALAAGAEPKP
jgi:hypothetical protein